MNVDAFRLTTVLSTMLSDRGVDGEPVITHHNGDETVLDVSIGVGAAARGFRIAVDQPAPPLPRRRVTDDVLCQRIDPAIAVERALTAVELGAFLEHVLIGPMDGAKVADWLDEADNAEAFMPQVEAWWGQSGDAAAGYLLVRFELPVLLTRRLLTHSLRAVLAIRGTSLSDGGQIRTHIEIAAAAALYVRGFADALGWEPTYDTPPEG